MTDHSAGMPTLAAQPVPVPSGEWQRIRGRVRGRQRRRLVAVSAIVAAAAAVPVSLAVRADDRLPADVVQQAGPAPVEGVVTYPEAELGRDHVTGPIRYAQTPPVGGDHDPVPQTCGVYADPIRAEHAVHSLEHGALWITYRPGLDEEGLDRLRTITTDAGSYGLLSPLANQPAQVVATVWGRQLLADDAADPRLADFAELYANGPQTPERGAACFGTDVLDE